VSERENYRETMVPGSDLMLKCWTDGNRIMSVISWPPHGIERPMAIRLTLSDDEVSQLAQAFTSRDWTPVQDLLVNIGAAVLVHCGILRKMQEMVPDLKVSPPPRE
jgi:hypothetical protein